MVNDSGESTATVTWNFAFTDNSLLMGEVGITEDSFQVVLIINNIEVDTSLPKTLSIGTNRVVYEVTDPAGNSAECFFLVNVEGNY